MKVPQAKFSGKIPISRHFYSKESHAIIRLSWYKLFIILKQKHINFIQKPKISGSKTEIGLLNFLTKNNTDYQELRTKLTPSDKPLIRFAFSSRRRKMGTVVRAGEDVLRLHEKGSPETILYSCNEVHTPDVLLFIIFFALKYTYNHLRIPFFQ